MPIRSSDNSKLPSIPLSQNISAHFPRTVVKKVDFNGEDIFKDVEKKRIQSTQRFDKKNKKSYFLEENQLNEVQQLTIFPAKKNDSLLLETKTLGVERKTMA
jgi:hypothetical protein